MGLREEPFEQTPLQPDEIGETLLIGREVRLQHLTSLSKQALDSRLLKASMGLEKLVSVNVAAFRLMKQSLEGNLPCLYIPCRRVFQLSADANLVEFIDGIYLEIAQTIINFQEVVLKRWDNIRKITPIAQWLNSPKFGAVQEEELMFLEVAPR